MDISLKEAIYSAASPEQWVNGGAFEKLAMELGYKSSNASRRCRDLVAENRFERKIINGTVWYKRKPAITLPPAFLPKQPKAGKLF